MKTESFDFFDYVILFLLLILIIYPPLVHGALKPWSIALVQGTAALMSMIWLFRVYRRGELAMNTAGVFIFIILFILFVTVQMYTGSVYRYATKAELLKLIAYFFILFIGSQWIISRRKIEIITACIIIMGFIVSIIYIVNYFHISSARSFINPDHVAGYLGMTIPLAIGFFLPGRYRIKKTVRSVFSQALPY
ncbi:MAG: hypothetical protein GF384_00745 [Elusimicrobia bacterium]|nr:hypothetical protein [Elusimicrobiota bacterium]